MENELITETLERRQKASEVTGKPYQTKLYGIKEKKISGLIEKLHQIDPSLQVVTLKSPGDAEKNSSILQAFQNSAGERKSNVLVVTTDKYDQQLQQHPDSDDAAIFNSFVAPYGDLLGD